MTRKNSIGTSAQKHMTMVFAVGTVTATMCGLGGCLPQASGYETYLLCVRILDSGNLLVLLDMAHIGFNELCHAGLGASSVELDQSNTSCRVVKPQELMQTSSSGHIAHIDSPCCRKAGDSTDGACVVVHMMCSVADFPFYVLSMLHRGFVPLSFHSGLRLSSAPSLQRAQAGKHLMYNQIMSCSSVCAIRYLLGYAWVL